MLIKVPLSGLMLGSQYRRNHQSVDQMFWQQFSQINYYVVE